MADRKLNMRKQAGTGYERQAEEHPG